MTSRLLENSSAPPLWRLSVLLPLLLIAMREDVLRMIAVGGAVADWSHVFALPIVVLVFVLLRRDDLKACVKEPSFLGLLLLVMAIFCWFAVVALGLFGYARSLAFGMAMAGVVLLASGRQVFRICLPMLIAVVLCLPLFERSMDRFSIQVQNASVRAGAFATGMLMSGGVHVEGREVVRTVGDGVQAVGQGEQRLGFRLVQACAMLGLLIVFAKRRSLPKLFFLAMAFLPALLIVNVLRIIVWLGLSFWRGAEVTDTIPRNISSVAALLLTFLIVGGICWFLEFLSGLSRLFYVEDGDAGTQADAMENVAS